MTLKFEITPDIQSLVKYKNRASGLLLKVSRIRALFYVLCLVFLISLLQRLRVTVNGHKHPLVNFDDSETESELEEVCGQVSPGLVTRVA